MFPGRYWALAELEENSFDVSPSFAGACRFHFDILSDLGISEFRASDEKQVRITNDKKQDTNHIEIVDFVIDYIATAFKS